MIDLCVCMPTLNKRNLKYFIWIATGRVYGALEYSLIVDIQCDVISVRTCLDRHFQGKLRPKNGPKSDQLRTIVSNPFQTEHDVVKWLFGNRVFSF